MKIFPFDSIKLRVVKNNTKSSILYIQGVNSESIQYSYENECEKRKWLNTDDIEVLIDDIGIELGSDLIIGIKLKP